MIKRKSYERENDLIGAFLRGQVDRRRLMKGLSALGVTAATAGTLLNLAHTRALAADFDWMAHKGKSIKLLLNKHPYADAMIANLENFKQCCVPAGWRDSPGVERGLAFARERLSRWT